MHINNPQLIKVVFTFFQDCHQGNMDIFTPYPVRLGGNNLCLAHSLEILFTALSIIKLSGTKRDLAMSFILFPNVLPPFTNTCIYELTRQNY